MADRARLLVLLVLRTVPFGTSTTLLLRERTLLVLISHLSYKKNPHRYVRIKWRTGRDSNSRWALDPNTLSRRAPSTTRPPVHCKCLYTPFFYKNQVFSFILFLFA